jgi:tetratricopeptide (TPR) repeat protein
MRFSLAQLLSAFALLLLSGCSQGPVAWWKSVNAKVKQLNHLEASHHALAEEHDRLKRDYFRLESDYLELRARLESNELGERNLKATGSPEGRSLSSIAYQPPKDLRTEDMIALAYEHFKEKRFAEAAATFESFLKKPESAAFVDANAMYTAGVSWFQLGNYIKAREHFEGARNGASGEQRERIHKKVDLWLRAIDRRGGFREETREPASVHEKHGAHQVPEAHKAYHSEEAHEPHHSAPDAPASQAHHGGKLGD